MLSYKARRRLSLLILLVGLPLYIVVAVNVIALLTDLRSWSKCSSMSHLACFGRFPLNMCSVAWVRQILTKINP
jgi:hypothetical protein